MAGPSRATALAVSVCMLVAIVVGSVVVVAAPSRPREADKIERPPRQPRDARDAEIIKMAEFAVSELQKLSESGIYRTLTLGNIDDAESAEGVYHFNYFLKLSLNSPYFKTPGPSKHDIIVMRGLEDGVLSIAIDNFPIMDEDAIEEFWIQHVEEARSSRQALFDSLVKDNAAAAGTDSYSEL